MGSDTMEQLPIVRYTIVFKNVISNIDQKVLTLASYPKEFNQSCIKVACLPDESCRDSVDLEHREASKQHLTDVRVLQITNITSTLSQLWTLLLA